MNSYVAIRLALTESDHRQSTLPMKPRGPIWPTRNLRPSTFPRPAGSYAPDDRCDSLRSLERRSNGSGASIHPENGPSRSGCDCIFIRLARQASSRSRHRAPKSHGLVVDEIAVGLLAIVSAIAGNWPQWRGPSLNGTSDEENLPVHWSQEPNVVWKLAMPSWSGSTPIVWGNRIFLNVARGRNLELWSVDGKPRFGAVEATFVEAET